VRVCARTASVRAASIGSHASSTVTPSRDLQRGQSIRPDKAPVLKRIPHRSQWNIFLNSLWRDALLSSREGKTLSAPL
jgi:hypothetical protein